MANKRGPKPGNGKGMPLPQNTALARVRAHEIAKSDQAPLKIMLDNMMFWHNQSQSIGLELQDVINVMKRSGADEALIDKTNGLMKGFIAARQNAQSCAVDAAPYVHPKFQSVAIKINNGKKILDVETVVPVTMVGAPGTDGVAAAAGPDRSYREDYQSETVIPIRRVG